jgi:hypothetical protein
VTNAHGTSATSSADQFTFESADAPRLVNLGPSSGPQASGTSVTLLGFHFTGATQVYFGSVAASSFAVGSDNQITATAPAQAAGDVDVTVVTPSGTSDVVDVGRFTYETAAPTVTGLDVTSGPTAGGTAVTVSGSNVLGATAVYFGGTPALLFKINGDDSLTAVAPVAAAGTVDVTVVTPAGTSATGSADHYTYTSGSSTPAVTALSTGSGPTSGGTTVTITGTHLAGATAVLFGGAAASFTLVSSTSISAVAPTQGAGTVDVTVVTPLGISATGSADHFTYTTAAPTVTALTTSSGTTAGGTAVTVTGTNFNNATAVTFGGIAAAFTVTSNTTINAYAPVSAAGTVDVQVTNPDGTSATGSADHFTFSAATDCPTVTALGTSSGPTGGGTSVTITGTHFAGVTGVYFGTALAAYTVASSTSITATAPPSVAGTVDVTVATAAGISAASSADHYTFTGTAPAVTALDVASGTTAGGTVVVLTGSNFNGATGVSFGSTAAANFTVVSATEIDATAPAHAAGTVHVTVTSAYGTSSTSSADQFTFLAAPTVSGVSPSSGSTLGGDTVTITGTNFSGLVAVSFGGTPAAALTVNSSTQITATAPAQYAGVVDITVTTANGNSGTSSADQFTFVAPTPTITSLSSHSGVVGGGGTLTITGTNFTGATAVLFGDAPATSYTVVSATSITATVPAAATNGTVDVTVTTPDGGASATGAADLYHYGTVAVDDNATVQTGNSVTVNELANDLDPASAGLTLLGFTPGRYGTTALDGSGPSIDYTPTGLFHGLDHFSYTIIDGAGNISNATVWVTVTDVPTANNDGTYHFDSGFVLTYLGPTVLANDTDPDGLALSAVLLSGPSHGSLTLNADGTFTFTSTGGYTGSDSFSYAATNGTWTSAAATAALYVYAAPSAANDSATTVSGVAVTVDVLANDTDPAGSLMTIASWTAGSHGTVGLGFTGGHPALVYTPGSTFVGTDTFSYTMGDGLGGHATATVTVTVGHPQLAAGDPKPGSPAPALTEAELQPALAEALRQAEREFGVTADDPRLTHLDVRLADLQNGILGITFGETIWIDRTAAGYGWYTDSTAAGDAAFGAATAGQDRLALPGSAAANHYDLPTVLLHEVHHLFGQASVAESLLPHDLMTATLEPGVRRTPTEAPWSPGWVAAEPMGPEQQAGGDQAFAAGPVAGVLPAAAADVLPPAWLAEAHPAASAADEAMGAALVALPGTPAPAGGWWQPQVPPLPLDAADGPAVAVGDEAVTAVRQGAGGTPVLVGGDGDDLVVGAPGRDVLLGGVGLTGVSDNDAGSAAALGM